MARVYAYDGVTPVAHPEAFLHPEAVLIGDVIIGARCYIGPGAVLRGDFGRIVIHDGANVQETCVLHSFPDQDLIIEEMGHIGHGAVLHGCHIGRNVLIGMNSVVMDKAHIGENSIVGALAFVKSNQLIPPNCMAVGSPARVLRPLTAEELAWKREGTLIYQQLAADARGKLVATEPLRAVEADRPRARSPRYDPLSLTRLGSVKE